MTRFTLSDLVRANAAWRCNCGPATLAATTDLTLDEVRRHFPTFNGWTSVTMMERALISIHQTGRIARCVSESGRPAWPCYSLARIQFEGPWTSPGANPRRACRRTRWIGAWTGTSEVGSEVQVFDIDVVGRGATRENGAGWLPLAWWSDSIVPELAAAYKHATGNWHITHAMEIARP